MYKLKLKIEIENIDYSVDDTQNSNTELVCYELSNYNFDLNALTSLYDSLLNIKKDWMNTSIVLNDNEVSIIITLIFHSMILDESDQFIINLVSNECETFIKNQANQEFEVESTDSHIHDITEFISIDLSEFGTVGSTKLLITYLEDMKLKYDITYLKNNYSDCGCSGGQDESSILIYFFDQIMSGMTYDTFKFLLVTLLKSTTDSLRIKQIKSADLDKVKRFIIKNTNYKKDDLVLMKFKTKKDYYFIEYKTINNPNSQIQIKCDMNYKIIEMVNQTFDTP